MTINKQQKPTNHSAQTFISTEKENQDIFLLKKKRILLSASQNGRHIKSQRIIKKGIFKKEYQLNRNTWRNSNTHKHTYFHSAIPELSLIVKDKVRAMTIIILNAEAVFKIINLDKIKGT